jgi:hypothetical protein
VRVGLVLATAVAAAIAAPTARANGDPASDVLPFTTVYFAGQKPETVSSGRDLVFLTKQAVEKKFPIRVAVIYQPSDLGLIQSLWKKPQAYANFLGQELISFGRYHGTLVVSMPNGFGVFGPGATARAKRALARLAPPGDVGFEPFGAATVAAVQAAASANGHTLPPPEHSSATPAWVIALAALGGAALAAAAAFFGLRRWLMRG